MNFFSERQSVMRRTASATSHSSVLMCTSGLSGASYGDEMPVKSASVRAGEGKTNGHKKSERERASVSHGAWEWSRREKRRTLDLARARLLVQTLGVARLDDREGRVDVHLDEREPCLLVQLARDRAVRPEWRDECGEGDAARVREELRDLLARAPTPPDPRKRE